MIHEASLVFSADNQVSTTILNMDLPAFSRFNQRFPKVVHFYNPSATCTFRFQVYNFLEDFGGTDQYSFVDSVDINPGGVISKVILSAWLLYRVSRVTVTNLQNGGDVVTLVMRIE